MVVATPVCGFDEFACSDGECIDERRVCDGIEDCRDREDEFGCSGNRSNDSIGSDMSHKILSENTLSELQ